MRTPSAADSYVDAALGHEEEEEVSSVSASGEEEEQQGKEEETVFQKIGRKSVILRSILDHLVSEEQGVSDRVPAQGVTEEALMNAPEGAEDGSVSNIISEEGQPKPSTTGIQRGLDSATAAPLLSKRVIVSLQTSSTCESGSALPTNLQHQDEEMQEKSSSLGTCNPTPPLSGPPEADDGSRNFSSPPPHARAENHGPVFPCWTRWMEDGLHRWIRAGVVGLGTHAAKNPWLYLIGIFVFSFGLAVTGLFTNFTLVFSHSDLFTPMNSPPAKHGHWYYYDSGFAETSEMVMIVHADGRNMLTRQAVRKVFEALDTLKSVTGYPEVCEQSAYQLPYTREHTCAIWSITQFWGHNVTEFDRAAPTDLELLFAFSQPLFPDGIPVFHEELLGAFETVSNDSFFSEENLADVAEQLNEGWYGHYGLNTTSSVDLLSHIPAFIVYVGFPEVDATWEFQERALIKLYELQQKWNNLPPEDNPLGIKLEFFCSYAYLLEYQRALGRDLPLIPVIFFVMLFFTMFVFHKYTSIDTTTDEDPDNRPWWKTRAFLGIGSVLTIGMSLMSGFGMMFVWGVPFTNITLMAPFIILGIGLDDTFIITGAYFRRLRQHEAEERAKRVASEGIRPKKILTGNVHSPPNKSKASNFKHPVVTVDEESSATRSTDRERQEHLVVERIRDTLQEVGLSISLTTLTTTFAFVLGCISTIPGIRWLCLYASVTIVFDFLYQVSFFVAILVLDERRVAGTLFTREDDGEYHGCFHCCMNFCCCCWMCFPCCCRFYSPPARPRMTTTASSDLHQQELLEVAWVNKHAGTEEKPFFMDRIMRWYAKQLLRPLVKVVVIFLFFASFGLNVYSTTQLEQRFDLKDYVPADSYAQPFFNALEEYSTTVVPLAVYFRNVDQSDPAIQEQMVDFVEDIASLPQIGRPPEFCWVRDMYAVFEGKQKIKETIMESETFQILTEHQAQQIAVLVDTLREGGFTFEEKLELLLNIPGIRDVYGADIVRDEEGKITASRCYFYVRNIDYEDIDGQVAMLHDQRAVTTQQPINQLPEHEDELPFFAYDDMFAYWQMYTVAVRELIFTTISGVVAVCVVGFIIIPHWSAILFVGPLIITLYFNLLGTMQLFGIYINAVTYVTVVIAIGLLVDFLMHILLKYYETTGPTREAKVKETLETMGASMLLGGFTSWLGVIPLAFSTTKIFMTLFAAFFAMVSWGVLVGLVFLPVLLSICGPVVTIRASFSAEESKRDIADSFLEKNSPTTQSATRLETNLPHGCNKIVAQVSQAHLRPSMPPMARRKGERGVSDVKTPPARDYLGSGRDDTKLAVRGGHTSKGDVPDPDESESSETSRCRKLIAGEAHGAGSGGCLLDDIESSSDDGTFVTCSAGPTTTRF